MKKTHIMEPSVRYSLRRYLNSLSSEERYFVFSKKTDIYMKDWLRLTAVDQVDRIIMYVATKEYLEKVLMYCPEASLVLLINLITGHENDDEVIDAGLGFLRNNLIMNVMDVSNEVKNEHKYNLRFFIYTEVVGLFQAIDLKELISRKQIIMPYISFIKPCINLYGILEIKNLFKLWKVPLHDNFTDDQFRHHLIEYNKLSVVFDLIEGSLVHQSLAINEEEYTKLSKSIRYKRSYTPWRSEIMKYKDDSYYKMKPQYHAFYEFLVNTTNMQAEDAEELILRLTQEFQLGRKPHEFANMLKSQIEGEVITEQYNTLVRLMTDYYNNSRLWIHRGYTPKELYLSEKPFMIDDNPEQLQFGFLDDIQEIPFTHEEDLLHSVDDQIEDYRAFFDHYDYEDISKPTKQDTMKYNESPLESITLKVGRNESCPCGSGKKFKKCCGAVAN